MLAIQYDDELDDSFILDDGALSFDHDIDIELDGHGRLPVISYMTASLLSCSISDQSDRARDSESEREHGASASASANAFGVRGVSIAYATRRYLEQKHLIDRRVESAIPSTGVYDISKAIRNQILLNEMARRLKNNDVIDYMFSNCMQYNRCYQANIRTDHFLQLPGFANREVGKLVRASIFALYRKLSNSVVCDDTIRALGYIGAWSAFPFVLLDEENGDEYYKKFIYSDKINPRVVCLAIPTTATSLMTAMAKASDDHVSSRMNLISSIK